MWRRTLFRERCPVWFVMARSDLPAAAAEVARPTRTVPGEILNTNARDDR